MIQAAIVDAMIQAHYRCSRCDDECFGKVYTGAFVRSTDTTQYEFILQFEEDGTVFVNVGKYAYFGTWRSASQDCLSFCVIGSLGASTLKFEVLTGTICFGPQCSATLMGVGKFVDYNSPNFIPGNMTSSGTFTVQTLYLQNCL